MVAISDKFDALLDRVCEREALVAVIGLGFVGTPEALAIVQAGFRVVGIDRRPERLAALRTGRPMVPDVAGEEVSAAIHQGSFTPTGEWSDASESDVVVICVPTPLAERGEPDLGDVAAATRSIAGLPSRPRLVVLVSTVPVGSTRAVVTATLTAAGRRVGEDTFVGFAPERLDPANRRHTLANTPRLVSGIDERSSALTHAFYERVVADVRPVSSPEVAEMAKAVENTFRFVNISFANELAIVCDRIGLDPWEVVDAAASKPFAFLPHFPGPGVGGSCIPVVPHYFQAVAREVGSPSRLVDAAIAVDAEMPGFVVAKLARILAERNVRLSGACILVVGVAYKPNVADTRNSPAIPIIRLLRAAGATVGYSDDLVPRFEVDGAWLTSECLESASAAADCCVLLALHASVDRERLARTAKLIFDTRNALAAIDRRNIVRL